MEDDDERDEESNINDDDQDGSNNVTIEMKTRNNNTVISKVNINVTNLNATKKVSKKKNKKPTGAEEAFTPVKPVVVVHPLVGVTKGDLCDECKTKYGTHKLICASSPLCYMTVLCMYIVFIVTVCVI